MGVAETSLVLTSAGQHGDGFTIPDYGEEEVVKTLPKQDN